MSKYGADGNVMEITLNTVKVRNFDKTITTIPTYAMVSDSFINWRGTEEEGARSLTDALTYEETQSDLFDHLMAVLPEFGLSVFQNPTSTRVK